MTCEGEAALVWPEIYPGDISWRGIDFEPEIARKWVKWTDYSSGQKIRVYQSGNASGYEFEATTAGRTAGRQPIWPTTITATVVDGSVTWTCRALSADSLLTSVSGTPTFTPDTGATSTAEMVSGNTALAKVSGASDGEDYTFLVKATMADGTTRTAVCILPVRRAVRRCSA